MSAAKPRPVHPGEMLREDFLPEYGLTAGTLAKALDVPRDRIEKLVRGSARSLPIQRFASRATSVLTPQFWMNLQANHDLALVDERKVAIVTERAA